MTNHPPALEVRGLSRTFGDGAGAVRALDRRRPRPPVRLVHRGDGPLRLGEVDAPHLRRRARTAHRRPGLDRRRGHHRLVRGAAHPVPPRAGRLRLPGLPPDALPHRRAERRAPAAPRRPARRPRARVRAPARPRRARRPRRSPAGRALRRPAAAGGDRPRPGRRPGRRAGRRADRCARLGHRARGARPAARLRRRAAARRSSWSPTTRSRRRTPTASSSSSTAGSPGRMDRPTADAVAGQMAHLDELHWRRRHERGSRSPRCGTGRTAFAATFVTVLLGTALIGSFATLVGTATGPVSGDDRSNAPHHGRRRRRLGHASSCSSPSPRPRHRGPPARGRAGPAARGRRHATARSGGWSGPRPSPSRSSALRRSACCWPAGRRRAASAPPRRRRRGRRRGRADRRGRVVARHRAGHGADRAGGRVRRRAAGHPRHPAAGAGRGRDRTPSAAVVAGRRRRGARRLRRWPWPSVTITVTAHSDDPYDAMADLRQQRRSWSRSGSPPSRRCCCRAGRRSPGRPLAGRAVRVQLALEDAGRRPHLYGGVLAPVIVLTAADRRRAHARQHRHPQPRRAADEGTEDHQPAQLRGRRDALAVLGGRWWSTPGSRRWPHGGSSCTGCGCWARPRARSRGSVAASRPASSRRLGVLLGLVASLASVVPFAVARHEGVVPDGGLWLPPLLMAGAAALTLASAALAARRLRSSRWWPCRATRDDRLDGDVCPRRSASVRPAPVDGDAPASTGSG